MVFLEVGNFPKIGCIWGRL